MKPFRSEGVEYATSVAVDASTYGDVTTAVAVPASRRREVDILNSILNAANRTGVEFVPFKSKSTHFDKSVDDGFLSEVVTVNEGQSAAFHFRHESASRNQHYVEAVLTALLLSEIRDSLQAPWFVLVDGDMNKVETLAKACTGIGIHSPTLSNCYKSEWYYPHSLLADLTAGFLAWRLHSGHYDYNDPLFRAPAADRTRGEQWGKAFSYLQRNRQANHTYLELGSAMAEDETERMRVWYEGLVARGSAERSASTAPAYIASRVKGMGYSALAERLSQL